MWPDFVVVSTPIIHFLRCVVKAQEPVGVQAFAFELAVEGFDEAVIRWLAWPRKIQLGALLVRPDVEIAGDELRSLVDTDGLGVANGLADALQGDHDILAAIGETRIDGRRKMTEGIDDRQHADLAAGSELVVHEIHCPGLVDPDSICSVLAQLGFHATLRRFVAQSQAQLPIKSVDTLDVDVPALTQQEDMDPAIAVSHPRLADLPDPTLESGLVAALRLVDVKCAIDPERRTGPPDRPLPVAPHPVDKLALAARPQSFF